MPSICSGVTSANRSRRAASAPATGRTNATAQRHGSRTAHSPPGNSGGRNHATRSNDRASARRNSPPHRLPSGLNPVPSQALQVGQALTPARLRLQRGTESPPESRTSHSAPTDRIHSGGKTPSSIKEQRNSTRASWFISKTSIVARPIGVRPIKYGPSQRKCRSHFMRRG